MTAPPELFGFGFYGRPWGLDCDPGACHNLTEGVSMTDTLTVQGAVAYLQQQYNYGAAHPARNLRKWLNLGLVDGELVEAPTGACWWETTRKAIDEAWAAERIPPKVGRPKASREET